MNPKRVRCFNRKRTFSQNNFLLKVNMSPESIVSKHIIKDHMISNGLKHYTINVNGPMLKAFRSARVKYQEFMKSQKEKQSITEKEIISNHLTSDIVNLPRKCKTLEHTRKMLDLDFVQCIKLAEEKNDMNLVKKGNALKRKSEENKE